MNTALVFMVTGLFAVGASLMTLTHRIQSVTGFRRCEDWTKYCVYAAIIVGVLTFAWIGRGLLAAVLLTIAVIGTIEMIRVLNRRTFIATTASILFGALVVVLLSHLLIGTSDQWFPDFALVFLLVSMTDSFAQLWGRLLGTHKLCPRLSPGKTWEGMLCGAGTAVVGALAMAPQISNLTETQAAIMGFAIASAATVGDLLFSLIKRKLGIKDFSGLLPGHGGIFDRFDSLIVSAPVAYWLGRLMGI